MSKHQEIGSEQNPAAFIDMLLGLTAEWGRVLAPHGSITIELGDTYSGSGGAGGDYNEGGLRGDAPAFNGSAKAGRMGRVGQERDPQGFTGRSSHGAPGGSAWPRAKSLALIPQLYAVALAYGINPLTGQPSPAGRWLVRNVIVWHRPNPAVGALGDKVRPSTSYIVVATRSPKRWFDLTAVRTPQTEPGRTYANTERKVHLAPHREGKVIETNGAGAPPLDAWFDHYDGTHDTWTLTTQPSRISVKVSTRVPCGPDDGGERTTSPDCPVHGDQAAQVPTAPDDGPQAEPTPLHTPRTDDHLDPERVPAAVHDALTNSRSGQPTATPRSTASSRTAPVPSTSPPDTPSAQTADGTARTPASPESCGDRRDTSASNTAEACPRADGHETAPRSDHTSDPESACSCTFHLEKDSIHSHYAMWPAKLAERLVLMMCPREVCRICGEPRRRVEGVAEYVTANGSRHNGHEWGSGVDDQLGAHSHKPDGSTTRSAPTLGWSDCGHDHYRPGLVLDPFAGSGTTLAVADLHGRDAIGVDFDARNKAIYPARYDEVKRALFGTQPELPGQGDLFAEVAG